MSENKVLTYKSPFTFDTYLARVVFKCTSCEAYVHEGYLRTHVVKKHPDISAFKIGDEGELTYINESDIFFNKNNPKDSNWNWDGSLMSSESKPLNRRAELLRNAEELINGDRAQTYGDPEESFGRIADLWNSMGFAVEDRPLNSVDVALALLQLKVSRIISSPDHADSWTDAAGYIGLGGELALKPGKKEGIVIYDLLAEQVDNPSNKTFKCKTCNESVKLSDLKVHAIGCHGTKSYAFNNLS